MKRKFLIYLTMVSFLLPSCSKSIISEIFSWKGFLVFAAIIVIINYFCESDDDA